MKPSKSKWKKIEHFIVLALILAYCICAIGSVFFAKELGLVRDRSGSNYPEDPAGCPPDPRYPC